jgi:SNF2 family DNA or RNA helicase
MNFTDIWPFSFAVHLIIAPGTTIGNWAKELQLWCPQLTFVLYRGSVKVRFFLFFFVFFDMLI